MNLNIMLVDVDGVLLDWYTPFHQWMKHRGYNEAVDAAEKERIFQRFNIPEIVAAGLIREFNSSAQIGYLTPHLDAVKWIKHLHQNYGTMFHVVSAIGSDPYARRARTDNLVRVFGKRVFDGFTYVNQHQSKRDVLERWKGSDVFFVEDTPRQLDPCQEFDLRPILLANSCNANTHYPRFQSWKSFVTSEIAV